METPNNMISHIEKIFKWEYDIPYWWILFMG